MLGQFVWGGGRLVKEPNQAGNALYPDQAKCVMSVRIANNVEFRPENLTPCGTGIYGLHSSNLQNRPDG